MVETSTIYSPYFKQANILEIFSTNVCSGQLLMTKALVEMVVMIVRSYVCWNAS